MLPYRWVVSRCTLNTNVLFTFLQIFYIVLFPQVRADPNVTWLACWTENIQNQTKYVMLNAASKLKGEKDWQKYETARRLHKCVDSIREQYRLDWKSKEMRIRQRAVALYFIDKVKGSLWQKHLGSGLKKSLVIFVNSDNVETKLVQKRLH